MTRSHTDISELLHDQRTALLKLMPRTDGTFLSAGCSGNWYFEWIAQHYGPLKRHVGIEYYSPKPEHLPDNVEWIVNTVGNMQDVPDASVDLLFSGQNLEHLWPNEVINFLCEAARVVKPGGHLTVDSPNRSVTSPLVWSHPEHMVEFTPEEARRLVTLAGFDVLDVYGIWLQRMPETGILLPLNPAEVVPAISQQQRIEMGRHDPENALLWWVNAVRAERAPDRAAIIDETKRIFQIAWPERCRRFVSGVGVKTDAGVRADRGQAGPLVFGPYMPLPAGQFEVVFEILNHDGVEYGTLGHVDVVGGVQGEHVLCSHVLDGAELRAAKGAVRVGFALDDLLFGIQMRVFSNGRSALFAAFPTLIGADTPVTIR